MYLQNVKDMSPQQAGFFVIIQPCVQAFFSLLSGRLADVYDIVAAYFAGKPLPTPVIIQRLL
jgi:hypothetical protein